MFVSPPLFSFFSLSKHFMQLLTRHLESQSTILIQHTNLPYDNILNISISSNSPQAPNQTLTYFNLIINILVNLINMFFCHFVMSFCIALTSDICCLELPSSIEFWRKKKESIDNLWSNIWQKVSSKFISTVNDHLEKVSPKQYQSLLPAFK